MFNSLHYIKGISTSITTNYFEHIDQRNWLSVSKKRITSICSDVIVFWHYRFLKRSWNSVLREKKEIIAWRRRFLREIRNYREERG